MHTDLEVSLTRWVAILAIVEASVFTRRALSPAVIGYYCILHRTRKCKEQHMLS